MRPAVATTSAEQRCLAAFVLLLLTPVVVCGLWAAMAHSVGIQGGLSAPAIVASGSVVALFGFVPYAFVRGSAKNSDSILRGKPARLALGGVALAALVASPVVAGDHWWALLPVLLAVGAGAGWAFCGVVVRIPKSFDGRARRHPVLAGLWLLTALVAVGQSHRTSVFMTDPSEVGYSFMPGVDFLVRHSCLTAYVHGASLARDGHENVYDFNSAPPSMTTVDLSPFDRDTYGYPPPFLLLPRLFLALTTDYSLLRSLWYVFSTLTMAAGWTMAVRWLDDPYRHAMLKLFPLFWISMPVQFNLQVGNFQLATVFIAILAMVAIERRRVAAGGLLLAFATLSKFSPGLLALALLVQRNLRAAAWTAGFGVLLSLAVLPVFGVAPWDAFFRYQLPRIQSGEALGFLDDSLTEIANNLSVFGIPFKFQELGLDVGWDLARTLSNVFSVILIVVTIVAARRLGSGNRGHELCVWLALLTLGALRSPFAPPLVLVGFLWLLVLLSAELRSKWQVAVFVVLWILFNVFVPMESVLPSVLLSLFRQSLLLTVLFWLALRRAPSPVTSPLQSPL